MQESFVVHAEKRTLQGKGASRRLRREGKVPVVVYGAQESPQLLSVSQNELLKHLKIEAFYSHILTLQVDGQTQQAVLKDLQRHPVRDFILHMDLLRVRADQLLRMSVPLHFQGGDVCPGVKVGGGVVEHHVNAVEVECLPKDLPQYIEVDLSALNVNESVHLSQLNLPEGVSLSELKHGTDRSVAAVHLPRAAVEADAAADAAVASAAAAESTAAAEAKKDEKKDDKK
jgi:large subunit ribosomal protein L25